MLWDVCQVLHWKSLQSYISIRELAKLRFEKFLCEVYWEVSEESLLDALVVTDGAWVMAAESMPVLKTICDVYFQVRVKLLTSTPKHIFSNLIGVHYHGGNPVSVYIQRSCDWWLRGPAAAMLVMCLQKCLFKVWFIL